MFLSYAIILCSPEIPWETSEIVYQNFKPQSTTPTIALGQTSVFWIAWHNGDHGRKECVALEGFSLPFPKPVLIFTVSLLSADLIESIKILGLNSLRCRLKVSLFFSPPPSFLPAAVSYSCLVRDEAASWDFGTEKLPQLQQVNHPYMQAWIMLVFISASFAALHSVSALWTVSWQVFSYVEKCLFFISLLTFNSCWFLVSCCKN